MARYWPQLRALLILLHLVAITLMALPAPVGSERADTYEVQEVKDQLEQLSSALERVGISASPAEIAETLISTSGRFLQARRAVLKPFRPYYRWAGTRQGYRMFSGVSHYGNRLHIEIEEGDAWRTIYLAHSEEDWRWGTFNHELSRSLLYRYVEPRYRKRWKAIARWAAREAGRDFPSATRVRVSWRHAPIQTPAQSRAGTWPDARSRTTRTIRIDR
ncbi:MAG: hypothetical protein KDA24_10565 [Deltaproteobacteria bacterium]|nr:hypothetical protein [Deltaproteobacteria bacterium]